MTRKKYNLVELPEVMFKKENGIAFLLCESYVRSTDTCIVQYRNTYLQVCLEINGDIFFIENEDISVCRDKILELIKKHKEELITNK